MQVIRQKSKASLFLIELLIVIAFFSVAAVVCVRLFAEAHLLSASGRDLNRAMAAASSAAECFKSAQGDPALTAEFFTAAPGNSKDAFFLLNGEPASLPQDSLGDEADLLFFFDDSFEPAGEDGSFRLLLSIRQEGGLSVADISVSKSDAPEGEGPVFAIRAASSAAGIKGETP